MAPAVPEGAPVSASLGLFRLNKDVSEFPTGDYLVRVACNSGETLRSYELWVDGKKADLENHPYINMNLGLTRLPYSTHGLSWVPGWKVHFAKGRHTLELRWPADRPAPGLIVDAICLQRDAMQTPRTTDRR